MSTPLRRPLFISIRAREQKRRKGDGLKLYLRVTLTEQRPGEKEAGQELQAGGEAAVGGGGGVRTERGPERNAAPGPACKVQAEPASGRACVPALEAQLFPLLASTSSWRTPDPRAVGLASNPDTDEQGPCDSHPGLSAHPQTQGRRADGGAGRTHLCAAGGAW